MKKLLVRGVGVAVVLAVLLVLLLAAAIVFGTAKTPPPLRTVVDTAKAMDTTGLPPANRYVARDGARLAYRLYPADGPRVAVLYHGSSDRSVGMHAVAKALATSGVTAYAVDVRGHGESGPHGDIAYIGQLEDDLTDLVAHIRADKRAGPITLLGHSSGGGFVLRVMGSPVNALFDQFVATSPYLHHRAATSRGVDGGGWAAPYIPRIVALSILSRSGIDRFGGLPVVAFALPPEAPGTKSYSFRLYRNYGPHDDFVNDVRVNGRKLTLLAGVDDEVFRADRYAEALSPVSQQVSVTLLPGLKHMEIVSSNPAALQAIVAAVNAAPERAAPAR